MSAIKALRLEGPKQASLVDVDMPEMRKGVALLKLKYAGVCGSDLKMYLGKMNNAVYPMISGHEFSAEIVEIGPNDKGLEPGMTVTATPYFGCGECYSCRHGFLNCCENNRCMGVRIDGAFQQYITMPIEKICHGKGLDAKTLAIIEPFANSRHLIRRVGVNAGETFLIFGAGPIGSLAMVDAKRLGAEVYIADISQKRLEYAKALGADGTINFNNESLEDALKRVTGGDGFDVTIEAVGHPAVFQDCMKAVSYRGRMGMIGVTKESFEFNQEIISWKEFSIIGTRNSEREDFETLIDLISKGEIKNADKVVSDVYPFENAVEMFKELETKATEKLKVLVEFS